MAETENLVAEIEALSAKLAEAKTSIATRIIGQEDVVDLALTAMLSGGHALLMGLPGLGKTLLVDTLSTTMGLSANRVQFTPDLMPADILGRFWRRVREARARSGLSRGRFSVSCSWPTRSTAPRRALNQRFCRRCRKKR
jgi:MoxR-like ATPase